MCTLTCCALHTGQPGVYVVTGFGERCLYDGSTEDGRGPSDLGVPMFNETQQVTDILLLCRGTEKDSRVKHCAEDTHFESSPHFGTAQFSDCTT